MELKRCTVELIPETVELLLNAKHISQSH